jgi:hypothetical protein
LVIVVDDTLVVGGKNWTNVRALKNVLLLFEKISGLKVNFHKSMLFRINVAESWLHEAAVVMNCKHGHLPFCIWGCLLLEIRENFSLLLNS